MDVEQPPSRETDHKHGLRHDQALEMALFSTPSVPFLTASVDSQATHTLTPQHFVLSNFHYSSRLASKWWSATMMHRAQ